MALSEYKRNWQQQTRAERRRVGLCPICGEKAHQGKAYCDDCAAKDNKRQRDSKWWLTSTGRQRNNIAARKYRIKCRNLVLAAYGNTCSCCGEAEKTFLELDHVMNDGAEERGAGGNGAAFWSSIIKRNFPATYRILCCNCNKGRYLNGGVCPHEVERSKRGVFK